MIRILALLIVLASTAGCAKKEPPAAGTQDPIEEHEEVVSITATPIAVGAATPIRIVVTVSDSTGLMLPGRAVEIASSEPGDLLEPSAGETRANGAFVSSLTGTTTGARIVTAKVGDATVSVGVTIAIAWCDGEFLVGGQPPVVASWSEETWPSGMLTGDLDGDGTDDLILLLVDSFTSLGSTRILVTLDGGAGATMETTWPGEMWSAQLADFDGDGLADLVFSAQRSIDLLLGNGDGTFRESTGFMDDSSMAAWSSSVVVSGDSRAQLLVLTSTPTGENRLRALRLDAEGEWEILSETADAELFFGGWAGDFNRDGLADYVLGTWEGPVFWMGAVDGTFEKKPVVSNPRGIALVDDLDGDGTVDLLLSDGRDVQAWIGRGDGTFDARSVQEAGGHQFNLFAVGHFDDDGIPDLFAATSTHPRGLFALRGLGGGSFGPPVSLGHLPVAASSFSIVGQASGPSAVALLGWGSLAVMHPGDEGFPSPIATALRSFTTGDFDGDGIADIAFASSSSPTVSVWGRHGYWRRAYQGQGVAFAMASGDLDRDGNEEIVVLRSIVGEIRLFVINPTTETEHEVGFALEDYARSVAVGDFNGDGRGDIAVLGFETTVVLLSGDDGAFRQGSDLPAGGNAFATGDFDGDGRTDIVVAGRDITVFLGDGAGGFTTGKTLPGHYASSLAVADLDLDGATDIVAGGGGFAAVISRIGRWPDVRQEFIKAGGINSSLLTIGDVDGDAAPDIAVAGPGDSISILWGTGDGGFLPATPYPGGNSLQALAIGDFFGEESRHFAVLDVYQDLRLLPVTCEAAPEAGPPRSP